MSVIIGIDPGPVQSGFAMYDGKSVLCAGTMPNGPLSEWLLNMVTKRGGLLVAFELVQGYGRIVGAPVFETCFWTGRLFEIATRAGGRACLRIPFRDIKKHLCPGAKGKDADIRKALETRFGGGRGTKAAPGPLHAVTGHAVSALAVAVVAWDRSLALREEG